MDFEGPTLMMNRSLFPYEVLKNDRSDDFCSGFVDISVIEWTKWNNSYLAEDNHLPMYEELSSKSNVEYIAGGATLNSNKVAQVHYYEDEATPTGIRSVFVLGGERSLITNLSTANCYKTEHLKSLENLAKVHEVNPTEVFGQGQLLGAVGVSINAHMGLTPSATMKLKGTLGSREVIVLVDSGASHSFISTKVVKELELPLMETRDYVIQVANGKCFKQAGVCKKVELCLQGHTVVDDLLPFDLGNVDVVLGITWLRTLGEVLVDWNKFTMGFMVGDAWVCLAGDPSLCHTSA